MRSGTATRNSDAERRINEMKETKEEVREMVRMFLRGRVGRATAKRLQQRLVEDREFFEAAMPVLVSELGLGDEMAVERQRARRLEVVR